MIFLDRPIYVIVQNEWRMFVVNGEPCSTVANECIGSGGRGDLRSDSAWTLPNLSSLFYFG